MYPFEKVGISLQHSHCQLKLLYQYMEFSILFKLWKPFQALVPLFKLI